MAEMSPSSKDEQPTKAHYRRPHRGQQRPPPSFKKSAFDEVLESADDALTEEVRVEQQKTKLKTALDSEIERLKALVPNSRQISHQTGLKNKRSKEQQRLPIVDIRLMRDMFNEHVRIELDDWLYLKAILSNDVLSILRQFKKECFVPSSTRELLTSAFMLNNGTALSGDLIDQTAIHSWRFEIQEQAFTFGGESASAGELVARYAAKVYRRCTLINQQCWDQEDGAESLGRQPWRGHGVAVRLVILAFVDLLKNPSGFFATALTHKLARPMFDAFRPPSLRHAFPCRFAEGVGPIKYSVPELRLIYSKNAPQASFNPAALPKAVITTIVPFTAEEELALLLVDRRTKAYEAKTGKDGDGWAVASQVIPGRLPHECEAAYQAIETRLLDPYAAQQHKDKMAGWNYVGSPDPPQYPSEELLNTAVNEGSVDDLARKRSRINAMFCLDSDSEGEGSPSPKRSRSSFEPPYRSPLGEVEPVLGETMTAGSLDPKESRQSVEPPYRSFSGATRPVLGETAEAGFSDLWKSDSAIKRAQCPSSGTHNASFNEMLDGKHLPSNLEQDIDNEDSLFIPESARKDDPIDDEQESVGDGVRTVDNAIAASNTAIELLSDPAYEARNRSKDIRFIKTTMPKTLSELRRSEKQIRDESLQAHQARATHHKPKNFLDQVEEYVKGAERSYKQRSAELRGQREENAKLRSENVELSAENTVLKAKIAELEAAKAVEQQRVDELITGQKDTKYLQYLAGSRSEQVARLRGTLSGVEQKNTKIKSQVRDLEGRLNFLHYQASVQAQRKKRLEAQGEGSEKASRGESA